MAAWIEGTIDFDMALRDPEHPGRIKAEYDAGDRLHPNDAGYRRMGDLVELALIR